MDLAKRYQLLETIGSGSFATVYRARDTELGREVAVKQIHQQFLEDPEQLTRYWQEAQLLASLQHPNIVTIYDVFRDRGWLILELMQSSLADRMTGRQLDLKSLRSTIAHALRALKYLHERGIIHGDVKPGNLMIDHRRRIKLGDFGLARRASDDEGSLLKGTTKYMAPEVVSDEFGDVGPSSDLYSLGFTAYELMCGPNFESLFPGLSAFGRNKQVAWMMWHAAPDRRLPEIHRVLQGVPDDLAHVIQKLCEKDPSKRYGSAEQALEDLTRDVPASSKAEETAAEELAEEPSPGAPDRRRRLLAVGAFAASFLLSMLMLFLPGGEGPGSPAGPRIVYAIVRDVLPEQNKLVVEDVESGIPEEIDVGSRPKIFLENAKKNVLLRELQPGDRVEYRIGAGDGAGVVSELTAARPLENRGRIKAVDLESETLFVALEEGEYREELPLRVPPRAPLELNGETVPLRDLRQGDRVEISHLSEPRGVGGRVVHRLTARRLNDAAGFVAGVDLVRGRLTVQFGLGSASSNLALPLAEDCRITVKGDPERTLAPNELHPGDRIAFRYDVEFREVVVSSSPLRASGLVRDVRPSTKQLVLQLSNGKQLVLTVGPETDVTLGNEAASLDDLRRDDRADVTYDESAEQLTAGSIDVQRGSRNDRWALVVGVSTYDDRHFSALRSARRDARLLESVLLKRYAFSEERLSVLLDPTLGDLQDAIARILDNARSSTQVVVFISTHGVVDDDGRVYLAGTDTRLEELSRTGLPLDWLAERLEECASSDKLLFLDACHASTNSEAKQQPSTAAMLDTVANSLGSTVAVASCGEGQRGGPAPGGEHGLFAQVLAEAFAGAADGDRDVHLTAEEVFDFLKVEMAERSARSGREQTPIRFPSP